MYIFHSTASPLLLKEEIIGLAGRNCIVDASRIICTEQLIAPIHRTDRAFETKKMLAKIWGIELLLQLAGTHQIKEAIDLLDVTASTSSTLIITEHEDPGIKGLIPGAPPFSDELKDLYGLKGPDYCKEVISKGVLMVLNKE